MSSTTRDFLRCFKFMHTLSGTQLICLGGSGFLFAGRWEIVKAAADGGRCSELANCSWSRDGSIRWAAAPALQHLGVGTDAIC